MNHALRPGLLAVLLAPLPALAGEGEDEWLALPTATPVEREGSALRLDGPLEDARVGGLVRAFYGFSDDVIGTAGGGDVSGVRFEDVQLYFEAQRGDFLVRAQFELASGAAVLEDGYVHWMPHLLGQLKVGQFKPYVARSASTDPDELVFRDRTLLGATLDFYDLGVELSGSQDPFGWALAVTNGANADGSEDFASARFEWSLYEDELGLSEGARNAPDFLRAELAVFGFVDGVAGSSFLEGGGYGADFALTIGPWYGHVEYAHLDDRFARQAADVLGNGMIQLRGNGDPASVTLGRRFATSWQGSLRWQTADDAADTDYVGLAVNHFPDRGPFVVTLDVGHYDATSGPEGWVFGLGVGMGATRPVRDDAPY